MHKKVTISDIARETGFGRASVSYVLAGKNLNRIKKSTQECILNAAKRLNYTPNLLARGLRCGQSRLIGVIFDKDANHFKLGLLQGIENILSEKGYHLIFCYFHSPEEIAAKTSRLLEHFIDGVILRSHFWDSFDRAEKLLPDTMPMVRVAMPDDRKHPTANVSVLEMARMTIQYLRDMGHSKIAVSSTLPVGRLEAIMKCSQEAGMNLPIVLHRATPRGLLEQMLALGKNATALVAEDQEAAGLLYHARLDNVDIPKLFSVLGNDGLECGQYVVPSLTTIAQPQQEQGEEAARMLVSWLENNIPPKSSELNPFLVERNSVRKIKS